MPSGDLALYSQFLCKAVSCFGEPLVDVKFVSPFTLNVALEEEPACMQGSNQ